MVLFLYFPDDYGKKCIDHLGIERKRVFLGEKCNLKKNRKLKSNNYYQELNVGNPSFIAKNALKIFTTNLPYARLVYVFTPFLSVVIVIRCP